MLFKNITILNENLDVQESMCVGISDDRICHIGNSIPKEDYGEVYDGKGRLLMSGFFNSHAHTPMTLMRGYGENMALQDWLNKRIFPFEAHLTGDDVYYATLLDANLSVRHVSTTELLFYAIEWQKLT